jgi:hypothetical protein
VPSGIGHPIAQRLVDGGAERLIARRDRYDRRAQEPHAAHIGRLSLDIHGAHIDDARQPQARRRGGARDAVLTRARLGDDASRAQPLREQGLSKRIVDLVRTRVREVLALQPHLRAPALAQSRRVRQRRGSAHPGGELAMQLSLKILAMQIAVDAGLQAVQRRHQGLGHVAAAERAVAALGVRARDPRGGPARGAHGSSSRFAAAARAARTNS